MAQSLAPPIRIGTRGSPLALVQAEEVRRRLLAAHGLDPAAVALEVIRTTGDRIQDRPLAEAGGKGLFTKEIEEALLSGGVDLAVHSAKDLPTWLPEGLVIAASLPREDVRDVFVSPKAGSIAELPSGATVGTAAPRRQALVKRLRPDLRVVTFRGNVETRLRKLAEGEADATLLALAGLNRLGRADAVTDVLSVTDFPPAVGQGIIAVETRSGDGRIAGLLARLNDEPAMTALKAERAFLAALDGSCRTPIAGYARAEQGRLRFHGVILTFRGDHWFETTREGAISEADALGADAGRELKARAPRGFFDQEPA
jgi:hydroxymethylbilane synthase